MNDKQKIEEMAKVIDWDCNNKSMDYCDKVDDCNECRAIDLYNAGYRKESDTVKEVLEKVLSFAAEDEVGLKWLIRRTAREYGVELSEK